MRLTESNIDIVPLECAETLTTINDVSVGEYIGNPKEVLNELYIYIREPRTSTKYKAVVKFSSRWSIRTMLMDIILNDYDGFMKSGTSENKMQLFKQVEIYLRHYSNLSVWYEYEVYDVRVIEMKRIELLCD